MITNIVFPGLDPSRIEEEIDYIDKDVNLPIYSVNTRQAIDLKDISTIVGKVTMIRRKPTGGHTAEIETYSRVLDEFNCELVYSRGIWLATLCEEDIPKIKVPKTTETVCNASNGVAYKKAEPLVVETTVEPQHPYIPKKNDSAVVEAEEVPECKGCNGDCSSKEPADLTQPVEELLS